MDARQENTQLLERVREFVFFHLGSDARIKVMETASGLRIEIEHQRVDPIHLDFPGAALESLRADAAQLEDRLLDELTGKRRSRGGTS